VRKQCYMTAYLEVSIYMLSFLVLCVLMFVYMLILSII